jgi:class 3 adenylate cyclase
MEAERRQVTVLFTDLVGFTAFAERAGEERAFALVRSVSGLVVETVQDHGGSVYGFTGDGVMAVFGAPTALEDAPFAACRAALSILDRLKRKAADLEVRHGVRPRLRIGVNTGVAVVGSVEDGGKAVPTVLGDTVNVAARLQNFAEPDTICISAATQKLLRGLDLTTSLGSGRIKGKSELKRLFRLDGLCERTKRFQSAPSRGLSEFVGRESELNLLERNFAAARSELRVIDIVGEPGIGKSRLLHEFHRGHNRDHVVILQGYCPSDGRRVVFRPFLDVVRGALQIQEVQGRNELDEAIVSSLARWGLASDLNEDLLLHLFGHASRHDVIEVMDGVLIGLRTRELVIQILEAIGQSAPFIMSIEDLQWIDSASEELLSRIIDGNRRMPCLILITRRDEARPAWSKAPLVATIPLGPLNPANVRSLVQRRIGASARHGDLIRQVTHKADGNPLFAEEIVEFLMERGVLGGPSVGAASERTELAQAIPASIQDLLAARVDRLSADNRRLLQAASAIGRRFDLQLLEAVLGEDDAAEKLTKILDFGLIRARRTPDHYAFKHTLVRESLYQSLLSGSRQSLHLRIAQEIERLSSNRIWERAEALAHHYGRTSNKAKAFSYSVLAGRKCLSIYSLVEAANYFMSAEKLLDSDPNLASDDELADYLAAYTQLLNMQLRLADAISLADRYLDRIDRLGDDPRRVIIRHHYAFALLWNTRYRDAARVQRETWLIAERLRDRRARAYALAGEIHVATFVTPKTLDELEILERDALDACKESDDPFIQIWTRYVIGWEEVHRGRLNRARDAAGELMEVGRLVNDPRATGFGLYLLAWIALISESPVEALDYSERALNFVITPLERNGVINAKGCALVLLRRVDEGAEILESLRERCIPNGDRYSLLACDALLSIAKIMRGEFKEGVREIESALSREKSIGNTNSADWYWGFLSEIYLQVLTGKGAMPLPVLLRNGHVILRIRLTAFSRIRGAMADVLKNPRYYRSGFAIGRALMILGLFHQARRRLTEAARYLAEARDILAAFGPSPLLHRVDAALASLEPPSRFRWKSRRAAGDGPPLVPHETGLRNAPPK